MAKYEHIKIYKKTFDMLVKVQQLTSHFPRDFRYTVGEKLNNGNIDFIILIFRANSARAQQKRLDTLLEMSEKLQTIIVLTRLAFELKHVSKGNFLELLDMQQDIEKQLAGWINYTEKEVQMAL